MRLAVIGGVLAPLSLLAACDAWETAPPPPPPPPAPVEELAPPAFEDGGCLGYLQLQRRAVVERRAEGDVAALDAAIAAWRARGRDVLSSDELTQYETSSVAVHDEEGAEAIAERSAACVTNAPGAAAADANE